MNTRRAGGLHFADGRYCGKNLYDGQGQADAKISGAGAQPVPALRTIARIFPEIPALPPLFPDSGPVGGNPGSDQVELVSSLTIDDLRRVWKELRKPASAVNCETLNAKKFGFGSLI